jgi:SAM-dependent methyltransferase
MMKPIKKYLKGTFLYEVFNYLHALQRFLWPYADYFPSNVLKNMLLMVLRYVQYFKDLQTYYNMPGATKFDFRRINPLLNDKYSPAGDIGQYFYQDIWAFRRIFENRPSQHVDVGSRMIFVGMLTSITNVTFVDVRSVRCDLPNFHTEIGDITSLPFPDNSIRSLSCLHVAEHIGLGRYGDKLDPKGTENAVAELIRVLAPDGNLFFSVPVANHDAVYFNSHRMYKISSILRLFSSLQLIELSGIDGETNFVENIDQSVFDGVEHLWGGVCLLWFKKPKLT